VGALTDTRAEHHQGETNEDARTLNDGDVFRLLERYSGNKASLHPVGRKKPCRRHWMSRSNNSIDEAKINEMPLFEFLCMECGKTSEVLVTLSEELPTCTACGSEKLKKLLSAPSSLSGAHRQGLPGSGDTACCGSSPGHTDCAGPGSCCGKNPF
jgi:putative FmdB family regulatory protein